MDVRSPENLYTTLRNGWSGRSEAMFLRLQDGSTITFADMDRASAGFAGALVASGVTVGDRVIVQVPKSPSAVALYLACLRVGAVFVPLNDAYTPDEVAYFIDDARPTLTVVGGATLDSLAERATSVEPVTGVVPRGDDDVAAMLYTSGTTGKPKGAMLTTRNLRSNAESLTEIWGFGSDDVLVHALPIFHVHGLFIALHCAMLSGCEVRFLPRFDVEAVREALHGATVMMGVPTYYSRLLAVPEFGRADCASMRLFISGSAPLTEAVHHAFAQRTGQMILERYGMTETGMITSNPLHGQRIAGTVGFPLPDVQIRVVDDSGAACPTGVIGGVEVSGPNVCAGYWGMPDKTAASLRDDGFFITGDLGSLAADGRLTLSGRGTDLIISGGLNIYPKEIELLLDEIDGVVESAVIGVPHPDLGDAVVAVLVVDEGFDVAAVATALDGRLARFKHPKHIEVVAQLPRNAMGKVEKAVLRRDHEHRFT
jgi:malonyl-CoA/methylmalonyl-CoA synthetase